MQSVAEILKSKSDLAVHTVDPGTAVYEAMQLMSNKRIGALVVVDRGDVAGIVTERDFAQKMTQDDRTPRNTTVRDVMSAPVVRVRPDQTTEDCMVLMGTHHIRHLPVVDDGKLVGMISIRDLVNEIIANL